MLVAALSQSSGEDIGRILLHEDVALEREPGWHLFVALGERGLHPIIVGRALHHIAMSVSRVAVGAAERAAHVRIDRPESHPRRFGTVENAAGELRVVANVL